MKVIYTDSANDELLEFNRRREKELIKLIRKNKYVFGDEVLEITASDIREAEEYFTVKISDKSTKNLKLKLLLKLYLFIGVLMVTTGLFYNYLTEIVFQNSKQLVLVTGGVSLILLYIFGLSLIRFKEKIDSNRDFE